MRSEVYNLWL